jgi:hypothetical protein
VNLFLALGGGWEEDEKKDSSAAEKVGAKSE